MTIKQLMYALTISEEGSMNRAAVRLFISQPTLTNAMKELEKELGITIFARNNKGVVLTDDGAHFLQDARVVVDQFNALEHKFKVTGM